jgi:nitroreductase
MDAQTVLTTTRTVRKRMDFDRPVPRDLLLECLEVAVQAPTGANSQGWQFVFVTEPEPKKFIADLYRESWSGYSKSRGMRYAEEDPRRAQLPRIASSSQYLADRMHEVPAMVIPCLEGRVDRPGVSSQEMAGFYGSILPAAWSFLLAARDRGLVGAWTSLHLKHEREVADYLGIPYERYTQAALLTLGFSTGGDFRPARRIPLEGLVHWEKW